MKLPLWLRLAGFTDALLALSLALKAICPLNEGCLTDPLTTFFFKPLFFVESQGFNFTDIQEIIFLFWIWFILGALIGLILSLFKKD